MRWQPDPQQMADFMNGLDKKLSKAQKLSLGFGALALALLLGLANFYLFSTPKKLSQNRNSTVSSYQTSLNNILRDQFSTNSSFLVSEGEKIQLKMEKLEIADETGEQAQGLMYRQDLCDNCGMLFIFAEEKNLSFWMKNTYVSLDMLFLDKNGQIVTIHRATKTLTTDTYPATGLSQYVLEVPANYTERNKLEVGQILDLDFLKKQGQDFEYVKPILEIPKIENNSSGN